MSGSLITQQPGTIYRSTDRGLTWVPTHLDQALKQISGAGDRLYLAGHGVLYSTDHGADWVQAVDPKRSWQICVWPSEDGEVYTAGVLNVLRSSDGSSFRSFSDGGGYYNALWGNSDYLYAVGNYRTDSHGQNTGLISRFPRR